MALLLGGFFCGGGGRGEVKPQLASFKTTILKRKSLIVYWRSGARALPSQLKFLYIFIKNK